MRYPTVFTAEMLTAAACRDTNPDVFFPSVGADTTEARSICAACPLTGIDGPCVQDAVNHGDSGIRGGVPLYRREQALTAGLVTRQVICPVCDTQFDASRHRRKICSDECRHKQRLETSTASHRRIAQAAA